jgi:hypothetical protein
MLLLYYLLNYAYLILLLPIVLAWMFFELRTARQWRILLGVSTAIAMTLAVVIFISSVPETTMDDWSAARLAQAISWVKGYRLYYPPGEGPMLTRFYGPVASIVYTPAAIGSTPVSAMLIGGAISFVLFAASTIWFVLRAARNQNRKVILATIALIWLIAARFTMLQSLARSVATDTPAIVFAVCACAVLARPGEPIKTGILCGIFAAMSVWSKQNFCPLVPALMIYALLVGGWRWTFRFSAALLGVIAIFSGLMILCFGSRELWFNMIHLPVGRPLKDWWLSPSRAFWRAVRRIGRDTWPLEWLLLGAVVLKFWQDPIRSRALEDIQAWARRNPWLLPLIVSLMLLPLSAYAYAQIGGNANIAWAPGYFALLSIAAALMAGWREVEKVSDPKFQVANSASRLLRMSLVLSLFAFCFADPRYLSQIRADFSRWAHLEYNHNSAAYTYAKAHPNQIYFPQDPLATLLADGKLYHWEDSIFCLELVGMSLSDKQKIEGVPKDLRAIMFPFERPNGHFERWLTGFEFDNPHPISDLPGWYGFIRARDDKGR